MEAKIPLSQLQEDIHRALKSWDDTGTESGTLNYLQLFRQAELVDETNARRITNEILFAAIETLGQEHQESAELLRHHFLDGLLMQAIANRLNIGQSTAYRKQQEALSQLAVIIAKKEAEARIAYQNHLENRLKLPPETQLIGIEEKQKQLLNQLVVSGTPWLASVEGMGGLGKTALVNAVVRRPELISTFNDVAWISAKQKNFYPGFGLETTETPALTVTALIDGLLEQVGLTATLTRSFQEKKVALTRYLKQTPTLIVVDNLETVVDYQALLPVLWDLVNPSKVVITSRHSLRSFPDVYCISMDTLYQADALRLIRQEAGLRGLPMVVKATNAALTPVYEVVGGNPLALKLVVGQTAFLPLSQVLNNLKEARGKNITDLYNYIYWQTWNMLEPVSRQVLMVMPLAQEGMLEHLLALTRLEPAELHQGLQQLATLSLVQVEGGLEQRRYAIHRLTETFLLNEAVAWQSSA